MKTFFVTEGEKEREKGRGRKFGKEVNGQRRTPLDRLAVGCIGTERGMRKKGGQKGKERKIWKGDGIGCRGVCDETLHSDGRRKREGKNGRGRKLNWTGRT